MKKFLVDIDIGGKNKEDDFVIIYKGRKGNENDLSEEIVEIKTSKKKILSKLQYFNDKSQELNEIYIHDKFHVSIFREMINTLQTKTIHLSDENYKELYEISQKYGYSKLEREISDFISERPDIHQAISKLTVEKKEEEKEHEQIDEIKEELIAKNLDFCLEHGNLNKLPISMLARILNSQKRVVQNHHLLIDFVNNIICAVGQKQNVSDDEKECLGKLIGALDYEKMTSEEIEQIINNKYYSNFYESFHSKEAMKNIIDENRTNKEIIANLENKLPIQLDKLEQKISNNIDDKINQMTKIILEKLQAENLMLKTQLDTIILDQRKENININSKIAKMMAIIEGNLEQGKQDNLFIQAKIQQNGQHIKEINAKSKDQLEKDIKNKEDKLIMLNREIEEQEISKILIQQDIIEKEQQLSYIKDRINEETQNQRRLNEKTNDIEDMINKSLEKINDYRNKIESLTHDKCELKRNIKEAEEKNQNLKIEFENLTLEKEKITKSIEESNNNIEESKKIQLKIEKQTEEKRELLKELETKVRYKNDEHINLINQFQEKNNEYNIMTKKMAHLDDVLNGKNEEITKKNNQLKEIMIEISEKINKNLDLQNEQKEIEEKTNYMKNSLEDISNEVKGLKDEYDIELEKMEKLQSWHNQLTKEICDLDKRRMELKAQEKKEKNNLFYITPSLNRKFPESVRVSKGVIKTPVQSTAANDKNTNSENVE